MNIPQSSAKKGVRLANVVLLSIVFAVAAYISACLFITHSRSKAFEAVQIGDSESTVLTRFGKKPSVREKQGVLFARYATQLCKFPCVERLWFENRIAFDMEAWSIEMDESGRVVKKSHWISP